MTAAAGFFRRAGRTGTVFALVMVALFACARRAVADTAAGLADFERGAFAEAYQEWREAADAGDPRGALYVGVLYDSGEGMARDPSQALIWYRRAAEAGSAVGAFNVAIFYDAGLGVARDPAKAVDWYLRAADAGEGRADYNLGLIFASGDGVPPDQQLATEYFRRAARHGVSAARRHLASLDVPARGAARAAGDPATRDFARAQRLLLARGPSEAAAAAELFRRAAEHNNALAEYDLAYCYQKGLGVPRNLDRADELYRRSATHATNPVLRSLALAAQQTLGSELTRTASGSVAR